MGWKSNHWTWLVKIKWNILKLSGKKYPNIDFVDKFPRFLQHIIPADNTRILETSKVRMGAQLAAGTTVMLIRCCIYQLQCRNFRNCYGWRKNLSSAVVGAGSDVGGGAQF